MTYQIQETKSRPNIYKQPYKMITLFNSNSKDDKSNIQTYSKFQYFQKRLVDFSIGLLLTTSTIPVMIYAIYKIKKESPGSIFFKQSRIGIDGKAFTCYKFRSMHEDSKFNPYTEDNDTRVFPFGNIMRKMRIDELPQLFNVLKGEMHLIGPRAEWDILVSDYEKVIPNYHNRHLVAPGITGLAQVMYPYGRNVEDAKRKLDYDIEYISSWSMRKELKVMFKTIEVILRKRGM